MSIITITKENFNQEVLQSEKPILVDFWASWCGPCRMLSPVVDRVADSQSEVKVGKINVDEQPDLAALSSYSNSVGNGIGKMSHYNEKEGERKWHYCIPRNKKN